MDCLRKIFGLGAQVFEKSIVKILCRKLGIEYVENKNYPFTRYLNYARAWLKEEAETLSRRKQNVS